MTQDQNGRFQFACISNTGKIRTHNEDNLFFFGYLMAKEHQSMPQALEQTVPASCRTLTGLFDGMGGECAGELASFTAARALAGIENADTWYEQSLQDVMQKLNAEVCNAKKSGKYGVIGSTATILATDAKSAWLANLGDSPAYLYRDERLEMISVMHTNEELFRQIGIRRKPELTQFLGIDRDEFVIEPAVRRVELQNQDTFLLCSDGLTDMVSEDIIRETMKSSETIRHIVDKLLNLALLAGGKDNITIIICRYESPKF